MKIRFYIDPKKDLPHIYRHDVYEDEVEDVLIRPAEDRPGKEGKVPIYPKLIADPPADYYSSYGDGKSIHPQGEFHHDEDQKAY